MCAQRAAALPAQLTSPWSASRPAGELKSLRNPPAGVDDIMAVVLCLLENVPKDKSWAAAGGRVGRGFAKRRRDGFRPAG